MLINVIDHRTKPYRWRSVDVALEPTHHDNSVKDSDRAAKSEVHEGLGYEELERVPLSDALEWAGRQKYDATLYIYDAGALSRRNIIVPAR